jgi:adenosylcobinamide amidohydrolase
MPSTIPAVKQGLRSYLTAQTGLRPTDGVTVRSATILPEQFTTDLVILGDATASQAQAGLASRAETPTLNCWVIVTRPGDTEATIDTARTAAAALATLIEAALKADPLAGGTVPRPGRVVFASTGLSESPVSWDGTAARRAEAAFTLTWTSHG